MRLHISLSPAQTPIYCDYQSSLVGVIHRWLGPNGQHNEMSLYGHSFLQGNRKVVDIQTRTDGAKPKAGFFYKQGAQFFINAHDPSFFEPLVKGIKKDPTVLGGMHVEQIEIEHSPDLKLLQAGPIQSATFIARSPVFLKYHHKEQTAEKYAKYYYHDDLYADELLTTAMHHKLNLAGLPTEGCRVEFERKMAISRYITSIKYRQITLKASVCPIRIQGTSEQILFGWNVGAGHSTGMGFGALDSFQ